MCNIKQRVTPTNYSIPSRRDVSGVSYPIYGVCRTNNNKELPYSKGKTTYNNCVSLCENDYKCAGYSYSNLGDCYIHNPTAPAITSGSTIENNTNTPLTQANGDINTTC